MLCQYLMYYVVLGKSVGANVDVVGVVIYGQGPNKLQNSIGKTIALTTYYESGGYYEVIIKGFLHVNIICTKQLCSKEVRGSG